MKNHRRHADGEPHHHQRYDLFSGPRLHLTSLRAHAAARQSPQSSRPSRPSEPAPPPEGVIVGGSPGASGTRVMRRCHTVCCTGATAGREPAGSGAAGVVGPPHALSEGHAHPSSTTVRSACSPCAVCGGIRIGGAARRRTARPGRRPVCLDRSKRLGGSRRGPRRRLDRRRRSGRLPFGRRDPRRRRTEGDAPGSVAVHRRSGRAGFGGLVPPAVRHSAIGEWFRRIDVAVVERLFAVRRRRGRPGRHSGPEPRPPFLGTVGRRRRTGTVGFVGPGPSAAADGLDRLGP